MNDDKAPTLDGALSIRQRIRIEDAIDRGIADGMNAHPPAVPVGRRNECVEPFRLDDDRTLVVRIVGISVAHRRRTQGHSSIDLELDTGIAQPIVPEIREDTDA